MKLNSTQWRTADRGFTLLELLIIVAIIGLLAAIVLTSLAESRLKADNARTLAQMEEYVKALELYYVDNGAYPTVPGFSCIGSYLPNGGYAADECWYEETGYGGPSVDASLLALDPYIPSRPEGNLIDIGSTRIRGEIYSSKCISSGYLIQYIMYLPNADCGMGEPYWTDTVGQGYTLCAIGGGNHNALPFPGTCY